MTDGPACFRLDFSCLAVLRIPLRFTRISCTGLAPSSAGLSMPFHYPRSCFYCGPTTPVQELVWAPPLSLAATQGITFVFFSSGYLDVSVPRVALIGLCIRPHDDTLLRVPDSSIRISADLCFLTAPRSVSPFDASFFSSMCLGIHRTPFLT